MGASKTPRPTSKTNLMIRLARQLTTRTLSGDIKWSLADQTGEKFIYSLRDSSLILSSDSLNFVEPNPIITLNVRGENGISLETLSTAQARMPQEYAGITIGSIGSLERPEPEQNQVLRDLYDAARSQALQPEAVIRRILDELGSEETDT